MPFVIVANTLFKPIFKISWWPISSNLWNNFYNFELQTCLESAGAHGMIFTYLKQNSDIMNDLLLYIAILSVTYLSGMAFVIAMIKVFFPVKTKEEWLQANRNVTTPPYMRISRIRRVQDSIVSRTGQLASGQGS